MVLTVTLMRQPIKRVELGLLLTCCGSSWMGIVSPNYYVNQFSIVALGIMVLVFLIDQFKYAYLHHKNMSVLKNTVYISSRIDDFRSLVEQHDISVSIYILNNHMGALIGRYAKFSTPDDFFLFKLAAPDDMITQIDYIPDGVSWSKNTRRVFFGSDSIWNSDGTGETRYYLFWLCIFRERFVHSTLMLD